MVDINPQERIGKIGGSDFPAILGHDPHRTPYQAWLDITGRRTREQNDHMLRGKYMEPGIANLLAFSAFGDRVDALISPETITPLSDKPWLVATPDRLARVEGSWRVIECKAPSRFDGELPQRYVTQANYYRWACRLSGLTMGDDIHIGVLCGELYPFTVRYDHDLAAAHVTQVTAWHQRYVETMEAPPLTSAADIAIAHPTSKEGKRVELDDQDASWLLALSDASAQVATAEATKGALSDRLRVLMADAEELVDCRGNVLATYRTQTRDGLDLAGMRNAYPDVVAQFERRKPVRTLLLKRDKIQQAFGGVAI